MPSKYDKFKLEENLWNIPCATCGAERLYKVRDHLWRAVNKNKDCRACCNTKHRTKPKNKNLPYTKGKLLTWGKKVKERDCCCQKCGATENLEAHHLFNKALMPELALCLENGIALCSTCHRELHSIIGKARA